MKVACPHCRGRMDVPEVYISRLVKCTKCQEQFVPEHNGRRGDVTTAHITEKLPREPDPREFCGIDTDHERLLAMCVHAKARGNAPRYYFLAAYSNAQTAMHRDTWQAAMADWKIAHDLLGRVQKERAKPLVEKARREFFELASDQLVDIIDQMQHELAAEAARMPERARRLQQGRVANTLRNLVSPESRGLVAPEVVRQVERAADNWEARTYV
ncbi:MAG: zinc-ribbon domain-containing protein [Planctomycetes bacterium]|nr:zinc-ribbon domain-containing protein [Planctomycetota bacterium]